MLFNKWRRNSFIIGLVALSIIFSAGIVFAHTAKESGTPSGSVIKRVDIKSVNTAENKPFVNLREFHCSWGCDLNGSHKKMTGTLYLDKSSDIKTAHVDFYGDDQFLRTYIITAGEKAITLNEDVTNIKKFSIVSELEITGNVTDDETMKLIMSFKDSKSNIKFGDITID